MKKQERKELEESLFTAIKKQLLAKKANLTEKFEKTVRKSIKQIIKKARKRKSTSAPKKLKKLATVTASK